MATVTPLVEQARETRRQALLLRTELRRLRLETVARRDEHVRCRRSCEDALRRSELKRTELPSWPAWSSPTAELLLTLVPLE